MREVLSDSYVRQAMIFNALHKKDRCIGLRLWELPRMLCSMHSAE